MIGGCDAVYLVLGGSEHAPGAIREHWTSESSASSERSEPTPQLSATVRAALERGQLSVQEPRGGNDSWEAVTHLALPLIRDGVVCGAIGVSVRGAMPGERKAIAESLSVGANFLTR